MGIGSEGVKWGILLYNRAVLRLALTGPLGVSACLRIPTPKLGLNTTHQHYD